MSRMTIIDKCFGSGRPYTVSMLKNVLDCQLVLNVSERTIYNDIVYMKDRWNAPIVKSPKGNGALIYSDKGFSIFKRPISQDELRILEDMGKMLCRFIGRPHFDEMRKLVEKLENEVGIEFDEKSVVVFDNNPDATGNNHIKELFDCINAKISLGIEYKTFSGRELSLQIYPYFLKQYNNRWFLIGQKEGYKYQPTILALDRITSIQRLACPFKPNELIDDINEYFDDVIGVTIPNNGKKEHVVLRFSESRYPYALYKPLHWSQKKVIGEEYTVSIDVIPNPELMTMLLSFGNDVEVVAPESLRAEIAARIKDACSKYLV